MNQSKIFLSILLMVVLGQAYSQSTDQNFVLSHSYKQKGAAINLQNVKTNIQYLDGLGRPMQTINMGLAPNGNDAVVPIVYDSFGRQRLSHLPYTAGTNSNFQTGAVASQATYYQNNTLGLQGNDNTKAYAETFFEDSPLNRPIGSQAQGANSLSSSISYGTNTENEVKRYDAPYSANGNYAANQLQKITQTDENSKTIETFTDKEGQVVCKKVKTGTESLDTYFIYDQNNRLATVLQPEYQSDANIGYFGFQYTYDDRNRLSAKKNPGAGWEYMVYDTFDRLRFSQDANQRSRGVWYFMKYDAQNRLVYSGEIISAQSASDLNTALINNDAHHEARLSTGLGYSLASTYPAVTANDIYLETFYDNYTGLTLSYSDTYGVTSNTSVVGQVTGTRTKVLGTNTKLITANYYDAEYRPIQTVRELYNLNGRTERTSTKYLYNLAAVVAEQKTEQFGNSLPTNSHNKVISYDHADRPLSVQETVALGGLNKTAYTQAYRYNQMGQATQKWTHSTDGTNYRHRTDQYYNIRGWLTEGNTVYKYIGNETRHFGYLLNYNNGTKYTNGNISAQYLANDSEGGYSKGQSFGYDGANRLVSNAGILGYNDLEPAVSYDKNGNIISISRTGQATGTYSYTYNGNQIKTVNSQNYAFDGNGNTTIDGIRALNIGYNYLNLTGSVTGLGIAQTYTYDASGQKLEFVTGSTTTKYAGVFEYDGNNAVSRVNITDGQARAQFGITIVYEYYHKDHLGNVRSMIDEAGNTLQRTDYYGFGKEIIRSGSGNKYNFLGRETQSGTGYVDLMARMFDPTVPHFLTQDPVIEGQEDQSLYQYGWNNPVLRSDPNGDCPDCDDYSIAIGMMVGKAVLGVKHSMMNLLYNAGDGLGITPAGKGMKWEASSAFSEGENRYVSVMNKVPMEGLVKDAVGTALDGLNVAAGLTGNSTNAGLVAKVAPSVAITNEIVQTTKNAIHANSKASDKLNTLYRLETVEGKYLKTGVTSKEIPEKRYSNSFMLDKIMKIEATGSRADLLKKERSIVETNPGPLNKEPWAGKKSN